MLEGVQTCTCVKGQLESISMWSKNRMIPWYSGDKWVKLLYHTEDTGEAGTSVG